MKRLAFIPVIALALVPQLALAADPPKNDPAAAQSLFYEARTLMQQNRFAEACPKLEESLRFDVGIGTQFNLADCNEHLGKITTAWAGFLEVAALSKTQNQPDREKLARKRAAALEPRLPKLVVEASNGTPGLEVKRDGIAIGAAAWGTAIPVDPGSHRIVASAPGKQWETTITASEGKTAKVSVPRDLPAAPVSAVAAGGVTNPSVTGNVTPENTAAPNAQGFPPPVVEKAGSTQRTVGWIVTGIGAVGVGLGAGFGLSSLGKRNESRDHCNVDACDATGVGLRSDAMSAGNVSTIAFIAGGAALAGGIALVLTAPKGTESHEPVSKLRAVPTAGLNGGGLTLQGNF